MLRRIARLLSPSFAYRLRAIATRSLAPLERRKVAGWQTPIRINLGSAMHTAPGWINVDLIGLPVELRWDVRRPLPFYDCSAEAIFSEHLLEHLSYDDALAVLRDCHRVLLPGGLLRMSVPDAGRYLSSYATDGSFIELNRPGRATRLLAVSEVFYEYGHRSAYDADTLIHLLRSAGFDNATVCSFRESKICDVPDRREEESLYVEAQRHNST